MKLAVCFCIHSGELEIKALLLAASLRMHWPASVELIACVPQVECFGEVDSRTSRILYTLCIREKSVSNPIGVDYPIANKLLCLDVETGADRILFLDSDILALAKVTEEDLNGAFGEGFVAKPADLATFKVNEEVWQAIYHVCGVEMPKITIRATTSGEEMAPYFNAGVIAVDANSRFGRTWSDYALVIDALAEIPSKRPHLDQIALPVAAFQSGETIRLLDEDWNFPAHLRPLPPIAPKLCHYHWPEVVEREVAILDAVHDLIRVAPGLAEVLNLNETWGDMFRKSQARRGIQGQRSCQ